VNGLKIKNVARVAANMKIKMFMKETGVIISTMAMENTLVLQALFIKDIGRITNKYFL